MISDLFFVLGTRVEEDVRDEVDKDVFEELANVSDIVRGMKS